MDGVQIDAQAQPKQANCHIYVNPSDKRVCVCVKDKAQCGKYVCAANLATTAGKVICFFYSATMLAFIVFMISRFLLKNEDDGDTGDPKKLLLN